MDSPSKNILNEIASSLFPELKREISAIPDEIRSAENRIQRIPPSLLSSGTQEALDNCRSSLASANAYSVNALKSVHQQYPH